MSITFLFGRARIENLGGVDADAGAHGRSDDAGLDILTLGRSGLRLDNGLKQSVEVLAELLCAEGSLADGAVDDVGLIETVLDLTGLSLVDSLGDIGGNRACLRAGHKTSGAENLTETADETHHVRGCDSDIEIHEALALDSCNKILCTDNLCACGGCGLGVCALCEDGYADILAGTVRKNDSASDLLVGVAGVNTQADVDFDSLIELCRCSLNGYVKSLVGLIKGGSVNKLGALVVFLTVFRYSFLPIMWLNRILPPTGSINQQL